MQAQVPTRVLHIICFHKVRLLARTLGCMRADNLYELIRYPLFLFNIVPRYTVNQRFYVGINGHY